MKWICKEHNQEEWDCVKGNGIDEYYHVKRCKMFELPENFGMFMPTDIARDSEGNPYKADYDVNSIPSPVAGPPVTITITKDNHA